MDTCKFCNITSSTVVDQICDVCEPMWLDKMPIVSDMILKDVFRHADDAMYTEKMLTENSGQVPVYMYEYGQNVRYIHIGDFVTFDGEIKCYQSVICTLDRGKGRLVRKGLHIVHTNATSNALTNFSLKKDDATRIVSKAISNFDERENAEIPRIALSFVHQNTSPS